MSDKFYDQNFVQQERRAQFKEFSKVDRPIAPAAPVEEHLKPSAPPPTNEAFNSLIKGADRANNGHARERR